MSHTMRRLALFLVFVGLAWAAGLAARATQSTDRAVRDALLRALPRYQDIPVAEGVEIERVEPYLDDELVLYLSDGSTYRVAVRLRSR